MRISALLFGLVVMGGACGGRQDVALGPVTTTKPRALASDEPVPAQDPSATPIAGRPVSPENGATPPPSTTPAPAPVPASGTGGGAATLPASATDAGASGRAELRADLARLADCAKRARARARAAAEGELIADAAVPADAVCGARVVPLADRPSRRAKSRSRR
jgi:hypothetical protein